MRHRNSSAWNTTLADGRRLFTEVYVEGAMVDVRVYFPEGEAERAVGQLTVERRPDGSIRSATVSSLMGDVTGQARTIIGAAEAYGSAVAQETVRQRGL